MKNENPMLGVMLRNQFYRRQYLMALAVFSAMLVVLVSLSLLLYYVIRYPAAPIYFATDNAGRLLDVIPLSKPNMSTDEVANWAAQAVEKATSMDYVNYRRQMQSSEKYFTSYGWRTYMSAIKATNNLVALKQRKMIFIAKVTRQPELILEGALGGAYAWKFEMPLLVTFWQPPFDETSSYDNAWTATVIIQRQSILQSVDGLAILQLLITTTSPTNSNSTG